MALNLDEMDITAIWDEIDIRINSKRGPIEGIIATYSFYLSGNDGGTYGLKIADSKAKIITGDPGEADCTLSMSVKDFKKLLTGNLNSTASYMTGKIKVKGSLGLALKLELLLKEYAF